MRRFFTVCIALLCLLCACKKESAQPEESPSDGPDAVSPAISPAPTPTPVPTPEPLAVNPLTGLPAEDAEQLKRRPVAIMMNNLKKALPMSGISEADVIYETLAEGGITRMLALFQNPMDIEKIGTIRSTRTYYLELALGHDAILVHAGASYLAYDEMPKWGVDNIDGVRGGYGSAFYRDQARVKSAGLEHSMYTSGERLAQTFEKFKGRLETREDYLLGWSFVDEPVMTGGQDAAEVEVKFTGNTVSKFNYNADDKLYYFEEYGAKFIDENNNKQVAVSNLLVLYTDVSKIPGDSEGRLTTRLTGTGEGLYAYGGKLIPVKWSKAGRDDPFVFATQDGSPLSLAKGKSYISILPMEGKVTNK